jgi:S-DNA-T family DNA segregation ATPase FtsK/SpoIIIE
MVHGTGLGLTLIAACGLAQLFFLDSAPAMPFDPGGSVGVYGADWLSGSFGSLGATVVMLLMLVAGISWAFDLSWFTIGGQIGRWMAQGAKWGWRRSAIWVDWLKGIRSRQARHESVADMRKVLGKHKPPRIEPRFAGSKEGARIHKEKQTAIPIFVEDRVPKGTLPQLSELDAPVEHSGGYSRETLEHMSRVVEKKLLDFNIAVQVEAVQPGPVITRFEVEPAPGVKASQIAGLSRDLARSLSVVSVRVVENIPGKTFIGLEIPNEVRETVNLVEGLASEVYESSKSPLTLFLGKDIAGQTVVSDLCKMPHLLVAGTTGSGKSVCINALILSIIYKSTPADVRFIMVDPKMLELSTYDGIPHLLTPVVTDMQKAANALRWCIVEMDRRFRLMAELQVRNIAGYNRKVIAAMDAGKPIVDPFHEPQVDDTTTAPTLSKMPYVVVIIDEFADLLMVVGKKVEELITRIAQRARAAGIHVILATQRPSVDVVTGLIKANIPTRVAFQVSSRADSRTVLDQMGAEQLLGHGDMLFLPPGTGFPVRVHGAFVSDQEVQRVTNHLRQGGAPAYLDNVVNVEFDSEFSSGGVDGGDGEGDPLYDRALAFVTGTRRASISSVQRQLRVGYNRAARMIEAMEMAGVVGPLENGKREVLAPAPPE